MKRNRLLAYSALAVVCIVWGTTYLGIRVGVATFPPLFFSVFRMLLAGTLILIVFHRRIRWQDLTLKTLGQQTIAGLFMFGIGNGLVSVAEVGISSGLASIIGSMSPIWVMVFNRIMNPKEKITSGLILGTLTGLLGIYLIFGGSMADTDHATGWGVLAMFTAVLAFAGGSVWIKIRKLAGDPFGTAAIQMVSGGLLLLPVSAFTEDWSGITFDTKSILVIGYLVVFGSLLGYFCYLYAIRRLPVTLVSIYSYINPVVAVLLGWLLLNEPLTGRMILGMAITLAGVWLVNRGITLRRFWSK